MARTPNKPQDASKKLNETATMVAALSQEQEGGKTNPVLERMANLLADSLEADKAKKDEETRIALEARKAGALAMQNRRDSELAFQQNCPHMKPWGGPSIGGQRDHQGNYRFICLFCSKMWVNDELPPHLKISLDRIGGPEA